MSDFNDFNFNNSPGPGPNTPHPGGNRGGDDAIETISWVIDIMLIFVWFPVGLFLTIANATGHNFVGKLLRKIRSGIQESGGSQTYRAPQASTAKAYRTQYTSERTGTTPTASRKPQTERTQTAAKAAAEQEAPEGVRRPDQGSTVKEVFGWILGAFGALVTLGALMSAESIWTILSFLAIAAGGAALIWSGRQGKKKLSAFRRCITVTGDKGVVKMKPLAKTLGLTDAELERQLSDMIDRGYYGPRAYIDHARSLLVIEPEEMRDVYKAEDEAKAKKSAEKAEKKKAEQEAAKTEYERFVERIRQADIDIDDEEMSEKIRQMQAITEAIFQEVEQHPEKRSQIDRFMNYYLPTTLKLLDSYARIEEQGVSGENMAKAKADIERIADTLVDGYKKQLDTLYRAEAVDIAGDVSVIENMMKRDGFVGQNDFQIHVKPEEGGQVMGGH